MSVLTTALRKICPTCRAHYSYDEAHSCTQGNSKLLIDDLPAVDPESLVGATLGERYHIDGFLEGGGMGAVLRATHVTLRRPVAIKILVMREYQDTAAQQRFFQEAVLASRVRHPNVIDIYDFGVLEGGHLYLVMEFLEGRTLRLGMRDGPMAPLRACLIASQMARGLQAVHDEGIVHRDLKPDNIFLLQRDGHPDFVKIVDFGIAKARGGPNLTQSGMLLGTPLYMAPEQIEHPIGQPSDHRVDQYSLGCVLYRMLTASLPFDSPDTAELLSMHVRTAAQPLRERRPDLGISPSLESVVMRLLSKRPEDRYSSMREVAEAMACEIERLQERRESTRLQVVSALTPFSSGAQHAVSGPMARISGPLPKGTGAHAITPVPMAMTQAMGHEERSSQTRLLPAPVFARPPGWRRMIVPAALGVGAGGVALFLIVAFGSQPPQALTIYPVQASQFAPVSALPAAAPAVSVPDLAPVTDLSPSFDLLAPADLLGPVLLSLPAAPLRPSAPALLSSPAAAKALTPQPPRLAAPAMSPPRPAPALQKPRPFELTVRFEIKNSGVNVLLTCPGRPPVRCEGQCVVALPEGAGECVASAPGSGYRPENFPLSTLRALPRDGKGPPAQPVQLKYIRL